MREPWQPGQNPREIQGHKERGLARYSYTMADIAEAAGLKLSTVRTQLGSARLAGVREDLRDLAGYILHGVQWQPRAALTKEELEPWLKEHSLDLDRWYRRWPQIEAWRCTLCDEVLLYQGLCAEHGGPRRPPLLLRKGYVLLRLAPGYVPLHRLLVPIPRGRVVHHKDVNKLNNRPENLDVSMTWEEHRAHHAWPIARAQGNVGR